MSKTEPQTKASAVDASSKTYENNPFFVATSGLDLLFRKAQPIGILLAIIAGVTLLGSLPYSFAPMGPSESSSPEADQAAAQQFADSISKVPAEIWLLIGVAALTLLLFVTFIGIILRGITDYTSARIATGKTATINEAFRAVFKNFWGYTWVLVVVGVKTLLWTLLFIIPGIIMSVRYSLAGVAYFDKALGGNGSVKHSAALTKGGWLTTYASQNLLNILTFGAIPSLLMPGTNAVLYRQFTAVDKTKPRAHALSWLTLLVPIILVVLVVVSVVALISAAYPAS
jgi:hypothetical protein